MLILPVPETRNFKSGDNPKRQNYEKNTKYRQKLKGIITNIEVYCTDKKDADFLKGDLSYKDFYHKLITFYKEKGGANA